MRVAGVEFLLLVEATLRISNDFPHNLCAALRDDQAMSTESHSAFWAIPQVVSLAILLRRNIVDASIEEAGRVALGKSKIAGNRALYFHREVLAA